jgi:hypothetical protein
VLHEFWQLEILLHDRRNISGQLECPPQQKDLRSQDENVARLKIFGNYAVLDVI